MASWLSWLTGGGVKAATKSSAEAAPRVARVVRASYDSAKTTDENRRHWASADGLSPRAANTAAVRRTLRNRSRYEFQNNSYCKGIVSTLSNDAVGTGPALQFRSDDAGLNDAVESAFAAWSAAVGLPELLRTMRQARAVDGEAFAVLATNPAVPGPVKLDLRLVEPEQVDNPAATPLWRPEDGEFVRDGVAYDGHGNPLAYYVSREHPGDGGEFGLSYDRIPSQWVVHWFRTGRPGEVRGVPEITPSLGLFAQLRRYTLAVIAAAETAADFAAMLETDTVPEGEESAGEPFETLDIEKRMLMTVPAGWKVKQLTAEQPTTTYGEFKREILNEAARCLNMPYNVAACNSSSYNYASGRLDHQTYHKSIRVDQHHCEAVVLGKVFAAWLAEAALAGVVPVKKSELAAVAQFATWMWPGWEHVDPLKEASALALQLQSNTVTLAEYYARRGKDWEREITQRAKEVALLKKLGLTPEQAAPGAQPGGQQGSQTGNPPAQPDGEGD